MIFDVLYCIISCPSWWTRACPSYQPFLLCKQLLSHDLKCFPFSVNAIHYIAHWIPKRSKIHVHHVWGFPAKTTDCVFQAGSKIAILHNWKTNFGGRRWTRNAVTQLQVEEITCTFFFNIATFLETHFGNHNYLTVSNIHPSLLAPKVLLDYLWPMITIHPTNPIPQSLFNHLNRPWIDLSPPPVISNDY